MMMKGMIFDDNMSNLTCASNEIGGSTMYPNQPFASSPNQPPPAPSKKKRNLPDPDAEVVALSPKTLMATNRFICEICSKGFQRDQNLQLHRRGHNLPWKLKQRANKEVMKKKVYVCPEPSCVHHEPSRALGDLTGIKKHFYRKHGEKKWKCEKCSKRYAVQSDWKAHSKICGTREYRCDCGTLFSRRDSFITHRAFCDALAEEGSRATIPPHLQTQSNNLINIHNTHHGFQPTIFPMKTEHTSTDNNNNNHHHHHQNQISFNLPPWLSSPNPPPIEPHDLSTSPLLFSPTSRLHQTFIPQEQDPNPNNLISNPTLSSSPSPSPHMSATALLQKAAQMGVTVSSNSVLRGVVPHQGQVHEMGTSKTAGLMMSGTSTTPLSSSTAVSGLGLSPHEQEEEEIMGVHGLSYLGNKTSLTSGCMEHMMMMSSLSSTSSFEDAFNGILNPNLDTTNGGGGDGLTRDFLGIRGLFPHKGIPNIGGFNQMSSSSSSHGHHQQNHTSWQGN